MLRRAAAVSSRSLRRPLQRAASGSAAPQEPAAQQQQSQSFIDKIKVHGANALLGAFTSAGGFDAAFKELRVTKVGHGEVEATLPVSKALTNSYGTLHGGAASTIVDIAGTMALLSRDPLRPGVSVELNTCYLAPLPLNDTAVIKARVLKSGKTLGFTTVDLYRSDGTLAVAGRHTKAL